MYEINSFGCVSRNCNCGGCEMSELQVIFPSPLNINMPTEFNINFTISGSTDINIPDVKLNVCVEDINQIISGEIKNIISGKIEKVVGGTINNIISGDIELDGCIGIKDKCVDDECELIIDNNDIYIEVVSGSKLKVINRMDEKIILEVIIRGKHSNGNLDFQTVTTSINANEEDKIDISKNLKDVCIIDYIINKYKLS